MWLRQRAARLPRIRKSTDASWKPPFGSKYRVWLAPPDYGQRLRADVICFTYHDLVFSRCQPGSRAPRGSPASEGRAGHGSIERLHRIDLDQAVWDLTERPPCLLAAAIAIKFPIVSWFIPVCALSEQKTRTARRARSDPTYEAHTHMADDRPACDRRILSDYLDLDLDWSLANRPSAAHRRAHSTLPEARKNPPNQPSEEVYKPADDGRPGSGDS